MNKKDVLAFASAPALYAVAASSYAVVPAEATDALTELGTDAGTLLAAGWGLFAIIVSGLALMGIAKKVFGKAT